MKSRLVVALIFLIALFAHAQEADTYLILEDIEEAVAEIEDNLDNFAVNERNFMSMDGFGEIVTYSVDDQLVKMVVTEDLEGAMGIKEFYYWDGELVFLSSQWLQFAIWPEQLTSELENTQELFYYHNKELIKWIVTTYREMDPRDFDFGERGEYEGEEALNLERFAQSNYDDYMYFLDENPSPIGWRTLPDMVGGIFDLPEEVQGFVDELTGAIEAHRWEEVIAFASPDHYMTQVGDFGMPEDQYILELLGLGFVDNNLDELNLISEIEFEEWYLDDPFLILEGEVTARDGSRLRAQVMLYWSYSGIYLTGAVG